MSTIVITHRVSENKLPLLLSAYVLRLGVVVVVVVSITAFIQSSFTRLFQLRTTPTRRFQFVFTLSFQPPGSLLHGVLKIIIVNNNNNTK